MSEPLHTVRFPGESPEYRAARNQLLEAEIRLRKEMESVASQRRHLPLGGPLKADYAFHDVRTEKPVKFSELFGDKDTLILYSYMYGPGQDAPCSSCTSILDGLDGQAPHVSQVAAIAAVARYPAARVRAIAEQRGWKNLRLLSSDGTTYNHDYHGEDESEDQIPNLNVFTKRDGQIRHFYSTELLFAPSEPGQDRRHVDLIWPLWNLLDTTPDGRGTDFYPALSYS